MSVPQPIVPTNFPVSWLRLEGLAVLAVSLFFYFSADGGWAYLLLLFFVPDLSMLGYLGGPRLGAFSYNLVHSYTVPLVLLGGAWTTTEDLLLRTGLIWVAHIGFDRMLGYGLKLDSGFQDTHLGRIGRGREPAGREPRNNARFQEAAETLDHR